MLGRLSSRLTYANVLATCALFAALGGTGFAAVTQLANGSVKTPKIANGAVTAAKVANGAVTAPKIANGAVVAGKIGAGAVGTTQLAAGAVGAAQIAPTSLTADRFVAGVLGGVDPTKINVVNGAPVIVNPSSGPGPGVGTTVTAACPAGQRAIGGGFNVGVFGFADATGPTADDTGWMVVAEAGSSPATVTAVVVCVAP